MKPLSRVEIGQELCQRRSKRQSIDAILGYTFGYRHQFGLFTLNYAKLLSSMYLGSFETTHNYAYFS